MNPSTFLVPSRHTEENRLFTLHCPVPGAGLLLEHFHGTERVSAPFEFTLDLLSERADLRAGDFLGRPLGVALTAADGGDRSFHGHVTSFRQTGGDGGYTRYQATLGPWTDFLRHRVNCKLFQNKNLPTILRELFGDYQALARFELTLKEADYPPITLCIQYQESDFHFFSRLLEAHGVHYFFRFEPAGHILVLADDSRIAKPMPGGAKIPFLSLSGAAKADSIDAWAASQQVLANAFASKTCNFKSPRDPMAAREQTSRATGAIPALEHYQPAGAYGYPDHDAGGKLAQLRMEELEVRSEGFSGASSCRRLTCGHCFELAGPQRPGATALDQAHFVTGVSHSGHNNHRGQDGAAVAAAYRNTFTCLPRAVPFRPALAAEKPRIPGPQTARVVGPASEEIHCDKYGRVRIQFHWDRLGQHDDASSCWVRVSMPRAGSRFGFITLPRIGQEVVVEFLDGDPDRPIITGSVYNELNLPPWELPANRTQCGLLTRSSKDGDQNHANALRFEDKKGSEEVWLHAEKDQRIEVEHDESHSVGNDRKHAVTHDESTWIGHDRQETVGNDESLTVHGSQKNFIKQHQYLMVNGWRNETVLLSSTQEVGGLKAVAVGGAYTINVVGLMNQMVGANFLQQVGWDKRTEVTKNFTEEVGIDKRTEVKQNCTFNVGKRLELTVGKASLIMNEDGSIVLSGTSITLESSGPVTGIGKPVKMN